MAEPHNHPEIDDSDLLIRRVDPVQHVVYDENRGCRRISSKAFQPSGQINGGMSIDIEKLIVDGGLDPAVFVVTPKHRGAVAFSADAARTVGLRVGYDPVDGNPYHGEVWGGNRPNKFTGTQEKAIRAAARWYVPITDVQL
jgi:hypothetical protein